MKNWTLKPSKSRLTGWNKNRHQRKRAAGLVYFFVMHEWAF